MVLCDLYLKKFDLTKGMLFDTFVITVWYKLCRCDHSVLEFKSFSPLMNWQTELKTSNEMHPRMIKKKIFHDKNAPQARLIIQNVAGRIFGLSPHGYSVLSMQYVICFPRITAQNRLLLTN